MGRALTRGGWLTVVIAGTLLAGCTKPTERLNAPPQGHTCNPHQMQEMYTPMTDNALVADMSMSAVHFVPHTSELNGTGVRRLDRYASLLKMYGGKLRYDGAEAEPLTKERMDRISNFLVCCGVAQDKFSVVNEMAGGEGMQASEAVMIRKASRFSPQPAAGGAQAAAPAPTGAGAGGNSCGK